MNRTAIACAAVLIAAGARLAAQPVCIGPMLPELTPQAAFDSLLAGNGRFMEGKMLPRNVECSRDTTQSRQRPLAVVLSCMDSRVAPEYVFDRGIGEIFTLRVAGNLLSSDVLGSMEYAVIAQNAKVIAVVGHTGCGAIEGAIDHSYSLMNLTDVLVKIEPAIQAVDTSIRPRTSRNPAFVAAVTAGNVVFAMDQIPKRSPALKAMLDAGRVRLVAGIHDIRSGQVRFLWQYRP